jgi:hypothetical protein
MALTRASAAVVKTEELVNNRNRIINGAMEINQRHGSSSFTPGTAGTAFYSPDMFRINGNIGSGHTGQQVSDAPAGFNQSLKLTIGTGATPTGTQFFRLDHHIEGYNFADFNFGTSNAKNSILSFWVKSSIAGTYGMVFVNSAADRIYVKSYTINSANTWEYKTVTIPADTSGTWEKTTSTGLRIFWDLGDGPDRSQSVSTAWAAKTSSGDPAGLTGGVKLAATSGATWQLTGVQLEVGSVATPFERRPYGTELALCQRYYFRMKAVDGNAVFGNGFILDTNTGLFCRYFPVTMRTAPTAIEQSGTAADYRIRYSNTNTNCNGVPTFSTASDNECTFTATVASGTTNGTGAFLRSVNSNAYLGWSAEL